MNKAEVMLSWKILYNNEKRGKQKTYMEIRKVKILKEIRLSN